MRLNYRKILIICFVSIILFSFQTVFSFAGEKILASNKAFSGVDYEKGLLKDLPENNILFIKQFFKALEKIHELNAFKEMSKRRGGYLQGNYQSDIERIEKLNKVFEEMQGVEDVFENIQNKIPDRLKMNQ